MAANMDGLTWRKSSHSFHNGDCVEVASADWHKASRSFERGECVEVAPNLRDAVAIRDSKRPDGPVLLVPRAAFRALVRR